MESIVQGPTARSDPDIARTCACRLAGNTSDCSLYYADDAAALLTKISEEASLRYAIHLITASYLVAQRRKAAKVDAEDVARAYTLFIDVKRSTQFMMDNQLQYLYNEIPEA